MFRCFSAFNFCGFRAFALSDPFSYKLLARDRTSHFISSNDITTGQTRSFVMLRGPEFVRKINFCCQCSGPKINGTQGVLPKFKANIIIWKRIFWGLIQLNHHVKINSFDSF